MTINPWLPEPNTLVHQVLGKMAEECNELAKIAVRCMIQGIDECDPGTKAENKAELLREIADVEATICWAFEVIQFGGYIASRQRKKLEGFREWQVMIESHDEAPNVSLVTAAAVDRACRSRFSAFDDWTDELRDGERYKMRAALTAALGEAWNKKRTRR